MQGGNSYHRSTICLHELGSAPEQAPGMAHLNCTSEYWAVLMQNLSDPGTGTAVWEGDGDSRPLAVCLRLVSVSVPETYYKRL